MLPPNNNHYIQPTKNPQLITPTPTKLSSISIFTHTTMPDSPSKKKQQVADAPSSPVKRFLEPPVSPIKRMRERAAAMLHLSPEKGLPLSPTKSPKKKDKKKKRGTTDGGHWSPSKGGSSTDSTLVKELHILAAQEDLQADRDVEELLIHSMGTMNYEASEVEWESEDEDGF